MQKLQVEITIPEDHVVIKKSEFEELKKKADEAVVWWSMKDLEKATNRGRAWITKYILKDPFFLNIIKDFTQIPPNKGGEWNFNKSEWQKFLNEYYEQIKERAGY